MAHKNLIRRLLGSDPEVSQPYPELESRAKSLFDALMKEAVPSGSTRWENIKIGPLKSYERIKSESPELKKSLIFFIVKHKNNQDRKDSGSIRTYTSYRQSEQVRKILLSLLLRSELSFSEDELFLLVKIIKSNQFRHAMKWPYLLLFKKIEQKVQLVGLTPALKHALKCLKFKTSRWPYAYERKLNEKIDLLLREEKIPKIDRSDFLGKDIARQLQTNPEWNRLLDFFLQGKDKSVPTKKWSTDAEKLQQSFDANEIVDQFLNWFSMTIAALDAIHKKGRYEAFLNENNIQILRGAVWFSGVINNEQLNNKLEELGLWCFKKLPGHGALSVKIGNACLYAFSALPYQEGISRLTTFRLKIKYPSVKTHVEKLINKVAKKEGKSLDEIEEMAISDYGLSDTHQFIWNFGDYEGIIQISAINNVDISWQNGEKTQKSIPAEIKEKSAGEIKALKAKAKEIRNALPIQKDRIESYYLKKREWSYNDWLKYYHNHPLISYLSKKLIWEFETDGVISNAIYYNNSFVNPAGKVDENFGPTTKVRLWHPINSPVKEIESWRDFLYEKQIQQPFKQAFREIYLVTEAELQTESYSNRFAAHILRQHQFNALCQVRGWLYTLMGQWDSHNIPTRIIPAWDIRAEYWVDSDWDDADSMANQMGVFNYISTDQVRFYAQERQLNMDEVPSMVFSEVMRDVDLFVGVTSIGNDPNWVDGGNRRMDTYWHDYSFGDLTETAKVRKEALERLIPRLKIADKCGFEGKYLIVKGTVRTYKIHIGSGNILMKPNDQYLCIVPDKRKGSDKLFLPFEGDNTLSIIISKALLLADDDKITDQTILSQIKW